MSNAMDAEGMIRCQADGVQSFELELHTYKCQETENKWKMMAHWGNFATGSSKRRIDGWPACKHYAVVFSYVYLNHVYIL